MSKLNIVVGGGISGLLASLIFSEIYNKKVLLIEKENKLGGLLKCFNYGKYGLFDYGMHTMYKSGIQELDNLLISLLPKEEWLFLDGNKRDLAGTIFNGKIQYNSPYPDLRNLSEEEFEKCKSDLLKTIDNPKRISINNSWDYLNSKFGLEISQIIDGIIKKIFGHPAIELSEFAPNIINLSRVIIFSEEIFSKMIDSNIYRENIAWPEQRTLPLNYQSGNGSYYPLNYGIFRIINSLEERLIKSGVKIIKESEVKELEIINNQVEKIKISDKGVSKEITNIEDFIWTSGLPPLAKLINIDLNPHGFDPPKKIVILNLLLKEKPLMKDLYYLYNYELNSKIFRITDFSNYCPKSKRKGLWPLSVELLYDQNIPSEIEIYKDTIMELINLGVIKSFDSIEFRSVERLRTGSPMPTNKNFNNLRNIRNSIKNFEIRNLHFLGILSEKNIFFQRDVVSSTWSKINHICQK